MNLVELHKINENTIIYIKLDKNDSINIQKVIYYILFLEYLNIFTYGITYVISMHCKSQNYIWKLVKTVNLF